VAAIKKAVRFAVLALLSKAFVPVRCVNEKGLQKILWLR
jgi:hypothetical protein